MPKRILIFSTAYLPFIGGAEIAVKEITDRINDIEFDLLTLRFDKNLSKFERLGNVNVYRLGFAMENTTMADLVKWPLKLNKYLFPFLACARACRLHRRNKYNGVWAIMAAFAGFTAVFFKFCHKNVPYLLTLQEGDQIGEIKKKVSLVYPLFKKIFTRADYVQTISNYLAEFARQMGYQGELAVVPNGVNVEKFEKKYSKDDLGELRKKLGIKDDEKIIVTASRLVKKNAVDDIIKALEFLPDNVKLLIMGDGPDREKLKELAKQKYMSNRIIFFGAYNNDDLPKYLAISAVFVRPSLSEGLGISFLEAMAAGVPVVATPVGGIVDFLRDGETGLFCEIKNPESIAEKIKNILENIELAEKIKANAAKMIERDYNWDNIAVKMENIFKTMEVKK